MERFTRTGRYMVRDGVAKERGIKNFCKMQLCFISSDEDFLRDILYEVSQANDCFEVKYSMDNRDGNIIGLCHFTNEFSVGDIWAKYESHPKLWTVIQSDEFCDTYRSKIRNYNA